LLAFVILFISCWCFVLVVERKEGKALALGELVGTREIATGD
jgi:hypothetical protein